VERVVSQQNVNIIVERLLGDEHLRIRFARNRFETIVDLYLCGLILTSDEIVMFVRSDERVWFSGNQLIAGPPH
jgi:hypothetical protein